MRWKGRRESGNVEDRRGAGVGGKVAGGGIGLVLVAVVYAMLGGDPSALLEQVGQAGSGGSVQTDPRQEEMKSMSGVVLAETEEVWRGVFRGLGRTYREPTLVLFSGRVDSACGLASSAIGPFYCGPDQKLYLDLTFFDELEKRFGAAGDFAQAYVIAHEVGHHVQNLLGTMEQVNRRRGRMRPAQANALSVRLELQADFYAGVWAYHARERLQLDQTDIREALAAAEAIGDDKLQMQAQGHVVPDSFTHGTSEQRVRWFTRGFQSGDARQGDTFGARSL